MKVVGIRRVEISNESGVISGYQYHLTEEVNGVAGVAVDKVFVSDRLLNSLEHEICLGDEIMPVYPKESRRLRTILFLNE